MILNWMLYTLLVTGILVAAGYAFEYAARALRLPTRWVWVAVIALSTLFSAITLGTRISGAGPRSSTYNALQRDASFRSAANAGNTINELLGTYKVQRVYTALTGRRAILGFDERALQPFNIPLLILSGSLAGVGLMVLCIAFARLSGVAYALDHAIVEGVPVLLSRNIGPALLGIVRFRIVLPRWVTTLPQADIQTILTHEQEHALAADPAVTLSSLVPVALQPWNVPIWVALSRLRLATETDCDARVLGPDGDARSYGRVLLKVYQRSQSGFMPMPALVTRTSHLESRIRRMMETAPKSFSPRTISALAGAITLCVIATSFEVTAQRRGGLFVTAEEVMSDSTSAAPPITRRRTLTVPRAARAADSSNQSIDRARRAREVSNSSRAQRLQLDTPATVSRAQPDTMRTSINRR